MPPTHSSCTGNISLWISFSTGQISTILVSTALYECRRGRDGKQGVKLSNKQQNNKVSSTAEKGSPALLNMVRSYILCTTLQTGLAQVRIANAKYHRGCNRNVLRPVGAVGGVLAAQVLRVSQSGVQVDLQALLDVGGGLHHFEALRGEPRQQAA
jgi:hypothetical protein